MQMMGPSSEPEPSDPASVFPENEECPFFLNDDITRRAMGKRLDEKRKTTGQVLLEGYVGASEEKELTRTKSLTDDDLDELKGCLDLGFGFSYDEIPQLCNTLPALELCYSMTQRLLDEQQSRSPEAFRTAGSSSSSVASWRISAPEHRIPGKTGDHPEDVKARLKFWAQAVACTVRLCGTG